MADQIRVNGNVHSWGSIVLKIQGERFYGFTAIEYEDARERALVYGMGKHHAPVGKTRGKYTPSPAVITGRKASVQAVREKLAALSSNGKAYGDTPFEVVVQFVDTGEEAITDELNDCNWTKNTFSGEENPDPLMEKFEVLPQTIRRNGLELFDSTEGEP